MDTAVITDQLKQLDIKSLLTGAVVARTIEAALVKTVKTIPALAVGLVKRHVQALVASGKINAPTLRLLKSYARVTFEWVDAELPDKAGPEKMAGALDRLAAMPYVGLLVRADRAGAQAVLQAAYDALDTEAKTEVAALGGQPDGPKTSPAPSPATQPAAAPPPPAAQ